MVVVFFTFDPLLATSQVCFAAAVHTAHRLRQSVIYVDTTGGLSAGRLLQMLRVQTDQTEEQVSRLGRGEGEGGVVFLENKSTDGESGGGMSRR